MINVQLSVNNYQLKVTYSSFSKKVTKVTLFMFFFISNLISYFIITFFHYHITTLL